MELVKEKKIKKKELLIAAAVLLVAVIGIAAIVGIVFSGKESSMEIETTYLTVQYPKEYKKYLTYEETLNGQDSEVAFFMNYEEKKLELFRIGVLSDTPEVYEGYLNTDNGTMYVALVGTPVDKNAFYVENEAGEAEVNAEMEALYYAMKDGMTMVMYSIEQSTGYSTIKGVFGNDKKDKALSYWTVALPSNITWEEKTEGNVYRAVFYGNVGEKKIQLYTISLNDTTAENPIGRLVVNGEAKLVSVEVRDPNADGTLTEEEQPVVYVLLDTINDVLQAIRQDKNFHDQVEPAA